jgi:hypothetical protein
MDWMDIEGFDLWLNIQQTQIDVQNQQHTTMLGCA